MYDHVQKIDLFGGVLLIAEFSLLTFLAWSADQMLVSRVRG